MTDTVIEQTVQARIAPFVQEMRKSLSVQHGRVSNGRPDAARDAGWARAIDGKLIEWGRDPSQLDDEDAITPSKQTIQFAIAIAGNLRNSDLPAPTRVVPDAHGGIVFEFDEGELHVTFRLAPDTSLDYCAFENGRLLDRKKLASPSGAIE